MLDLVGIDLKAKRAKQHFVLLKRTDGRAWRVIEIRGIAIGCNTETYSHHAHPDALIVFGAHERELIARLIGSNGYAYEAVQGYENSILPWVPQTL